MKFVQSLRDKIYCSAPPQVLLYSILKNHPTIKREEGRTQKRASEAGDVGLFVPSVKCSPGPSIHFLLLQGCAQQEPSSSSISENTDIYICIRLNDELQRRCMFFISGTGTGVLATRSTMPFVRQGFTYCYSTIHTPTSHPLTSPR